MSSSIVLWIGFYLTGTISLCIFVVFILHMCCIIVTRCGEASIYNLPSALWQIDTVGWVIWSVKTRPRYDLQCCLVGRTLNFTQPTEVLQKFKVKGSTQGSKVKVTTLRDITMSAERSFVLSRARVWRTDRQTDRCLCDRQDRANAAR